MNFLAKALDRISWPFLVVAGLASVVAIVLLSISVQQVDLPQREFAKILKQGDEIVVRKIVTPPAPGSVPSSPDEDGTRQSESLKPAQPAIPESRMVPGPPADLEARIRKRVHDELSRVQKDLERAHKEALLVHDEKRRDAEQLIDEVQREYTEKRQDSDIALQDAARTLAERRRDIAQKMRDAKSQPDRLRALERERGDALREYEATRREIHESLNAAKSAAQQSIAEAHTEIERQIVILGDRKTYKIPQIRVPDIRIPEIKLPAVPAPAPAAAPAVPAPPAPAVTPLSKDTLQMVERDVGTAVADTIGEEVHSAVKGYRLALNSMLAGVVLLLFSGAVVGKMVLASNRAARVRADLMRSEAERNLMSKQVVEAQLKAMQAQVEPHFLFNTLANVRFLMDANAASAGTMLDHLIEYLHAALPQMRESRTTIGKEVELARAYLEILRIRMGNRLDFAINVPPELAGVSFPPMMLLSLVENAIRHGLEPMREGGRIDIEAGVTGDALRLAVRDTGAGLGGTPEPGAGPDAESGSGVGLANIRARLQTLYGQRARLVLEENEPHGVTAAIEIPHDENPQGAAG